MLKRHVRLGFQADASTEDIRQGAALLRERVHDGRSGGRQRRLEHVAQDAQDAMETLVLARGVQLPLNARHHLGDEHQVDDQGRREKRVLADVEKPTRKSQLRVRLVKGGKKGDQGE